MDTPQPPRQSGAERARQRTRPPGPAGLANENRPGLGTRQDESRDPAAKPKEDDPVLAQTGYDDGLAHLPVPPTNRPPPVEQDPASAEAEIERATGMSGKSGGV